MYDFRAMRHKLPVLIRDSIKEVNSNTWLIGPYILHRSSGHSDDATWYDDEDKSSYTITDAPNPPPAATQLPQSGTPFVKVEDAGDALAIWHIGNKAVCKIQLEYPEAPMTPEDVTIKWVQEKQPPFKLPEVIRYTEHDHRSIMIYKRLPGQRLCDAWLGLSMEKRNFYVYKVVDMIKYMAEWTNDKICGVDGRVLHDFYLADGGRETGPEHLTPENLEKASRGLGLDCSTFYFSHGILGPQMVIIDGDNIGIDRWDHAGFVPKGWILTFFLLSPALDFSEEVEGIKDRHYYRGRIAQLLNDEGWENCFDEWVARVGEPMRVAEKVPDEDVGC